uniref:Uncharacterized protein n=1 Tax=Setaria viridis TaxID=4556 RepID=A0A4U6VXJ1_SETVI|nr:hypothetical protein SEVIR_2G323800v2 [Setaria viridis]
MASGSSGHGSSAHGGAPSGGAAAPSPDAAFHGARRLANLPAADLVGYLIRRNRRASDFVDVALVLTARERRLAEAEARARAAEEAAARLRGEMAARERRAAEAQDLTRRLAAAAEERLQAEIRASQRRATEAEARLQAYAGGHDHRDIAPPSRWSLKWTADSALTDDEEEETQAEEEEAPLQVASGKRKEAVASSPGKLLKKLKLWAWGGSSCSNAVPESEADTTDEGEAEDPWPAWEEDEDALAIIPGGYDLQDALEETETKQGVGEHDQPEDKMGGEPERFEHEPENPVALAVVTPGNDLPPNDDGVEASRGVVPEPEAREESKMTEIAGNGSLRKKGMIYKMVFKALKEKERQATLASASQPNLRCWLHAPLPEDRAGGRGGGS